jgi:prepilin-type N-terminal cleavage/methylation domain-containing protein
MTTASSRQPHQPRTRTQSGFTLLELLIVIVVLGILAAIVVFAIGGVTSASEVAACNTDARSVDVAVQAYDTQTGYTSGAASGAPTASNLVSLGYLKSFPSSSYYTIAIDATGAVTVATPAVPAPVAYNGSNNPCSTAAGNGQANGGASTTTSSTPTTTTSTSTTTTTTPATTTTVPATTTTTVPATTTTTVPATTTTTIAPTTTTTTVPSNGVTVTPSLNLYTGGAYGGQDLLVFTNVHSITAMTVTVKVAVTPGTTYNSQYNSFPGGSLTQSESANSSWITYTTTMNSGQSIPANYGNGSATIGSQYNGTGTVHSGSTDTWSVTSTSNGATTTQSGGF